MRVTEGVACGLQRGAGSEEGLGSAVGRYGETSAQSTKGVSVGQSRHLLSILSVCLGHTVDHGLEGRKSDQEQGVAAGLGRECWRTLASRL